MNHFSATLLFSLIAIPSWDIIASFLLIVLLLIASALISGSEVAFFSLTHNDFDDLETENTDTANHILYLKDRPRSLLATILISNNFINVAIVVVSDFLIKIMLPPEFFLQTGKNLIKFINQLDYFNWLDWSITSASNVDFSKSIIEVFLTVVVVTFLLVLFGEVAPKVYAKINNIKMAKMMAYPLIILNKIFYPFSTILVTWTNIIEKRLETRAKNGMTSKEDIDEAIELTVSTEKDAEGEIDILKSIVKFGDISVTQIMRSRVDVIAIDFRTSYHEVLATVREAGFSRIPVYENDFDNVVGILYVKDLLGHLNEDDKFEWQKLMRSNVHFVPETKKIDDLLKEFQSKRLHIAIVVDEYGGSSGIVTLEDVMEEVIGEIQDEFDDHSEVVYTKVDDNNYLFEGKTMLNDVCRIIGVDTTTFDDIKGESDSVAGLLLELVGRIPKLDREITIDGFKFKVVAVNKRRIEEVLITLP